MMSTTKVQSMPMSDLNLRRCVEAELERESEFVFVFVFVFVFEPALAG